MVAIIELEPDSVCTKKNIFEFCKYLPKYKQPRKIIFAPIPRNSNGIIEKARLKNSIFNKTYLKEHRPNGN